MQWYSEFPPSKILDRLYLGNVYHAMELAYRANPSGITAVLNVSTEPPYDENPGILYCHIPFPDGYEVPQREFAEAMAFLRFCWENGYTVLVHCAAGISRSTTMVVSFMHYMKMKDMMAALGHVKMCRPIVEPAPAVLSSCKRHLGYNLPTGAESDEEKVKALVLASLRKRTVNLHPDQHCQVRKAYEKGRVGVKEQSLLICTCPSPTAALKVGKDGQK